MALQDRQFQTIRRVAKGRVVANDDDSKSILQHEEFATAVVGPDGGTLTGSEENTLNFMLAELQFQTRLLEKILQQLGGFYLEDSLSLVG